MSNRGYTKAIGAIFSNWELVKDEILLPNRKAGSGNGTVHIYLLEDNMNMFRECFPDYIKKFNLSPESAEKDCPQIQHFVLTSNILTVAGFAYNHYRCDANVFNYSDYVNKVIKQDDNGMLVFNSLFKLSTEDRPYFKQFDKAIFGKIIRYIFVPRKTAYKLYLYSDEEYKNFAVFWIIGQETDDTYIVNAIEGKKTDTPQKEEQVANEPTESETEPQSVKLSPEDVIATFTRYMQEKDKSEKTISSYIGNLNNLIPRAQKMLDGKDHPSPLTITDLKELKAIDKALWSNPAIVEWNRKEHNRASAALHIYIAMYEDGYVVSAPITKNKDKKTAKPGKDVSRFDFTLTPEESKQYEAYVAYLKDVKHSSEVTQNSYANILLKRMSNLLRDHYQSDLRNVFAITDYKKLMLMDSEIWEVKEIDEANSASRGKLMAAFRAYLEFVEQTLSDEELAQIAFSEDGTKDIVSSSVGKKQQFTTHLPLFSVDGACGYFANSKEAEVEGWVDMSKSGIKLTPDMFVVHACGDSMEPKIHDGDLCIFRKYNGEDRMDNIILTQLTDHDFDYGGMYTIKKFHCNREANEYGVVQNSNVELRPLNQAYKPIKVSESMAQDLKTIGLFVTTISK